MIRLDPQYQAGVRTYLTLEILAYIEDTTRLRSSALKSALLLVLSYLALMASLLSLAVSFAATDMGTGDRILYAYSGVFGCAMTPFILGASSRYSQRYFRLNGRSRPVYDRLAWSVHAVRKVIGSPMTTDAVAVRYADSVLKNEKLRFRRMMNKFAIQDLGRYRLAAPGDSFGELVRDIEQIVGVEIKKSKRIALVRKTMIDCDRESWNLLSPEGLRDATISNFAALGIEGVKPCQVTRIVERVREAYPQGALVVIEPEEIGSIAS